LWWCCCCICAWSVLGRGPRCSLVAGHPGRFDGLLCSKGMLRILVILRLVVVLLLLLLLLVGGCLGLTLLCLGEVLVTEVCVVVHQGDVRGISP